MDDKFRGWLATAVVAVSIVGVGILGGVAIHAKPADASTILTMILPVIGTWVGTVLAFYFGKEQLEAATRSVTAIAREVSPDDRLRSIKAIDKMIARSGMEVKQGDPTTITVGDAIATLDKQDKGDRLPILAIDDHPLYVIHRSVLDRFVAKGKPDEAKKVTIADFVKDADAKKYLKKSFVVVSSNATLADVKREIQSHAPCQDAFVTKSGSTNEPVLGWITNKILDANARV